MEKKFKLISLCFIIGCFLIYGFRFVYFYRKFHKKTSNGSGSEVLAVTIQKQGIVSEGDGIYNNSGELIYKGENVNNYLKYSGILWRIVKVNNDNTVVITTDSNISLLSYGGSNYINSNINKFLVKSKSQTGIFENKLNNTDKYLSKNTICLDKISDASKILCNSKDNSQKISLLSLADYLNSKNNNKTYLKNNDSFWLSSVKDNQNVWYITKDGNLSYDNNKKLHGVRPVVTLKNTIGSIKGKGTKENPYVVDKQSKLAFNSYVKLGNDLYTVYDMSSDTVKLVNESLVSSDYVRNINYNSEKYDSKIKNTLAYYLNNTYLNKLTYKNKLINCDYYTGDYIDNYKDVLKTKITTKVGMLSVTDINVNTELNNYFYLNKNNNVVIAKTDGKTSDISKVRTTVCISKNEKLKGNGTKTNPFVLEG